MALGTSESAHKTKNIHVVIITMCGNGDNIALENEAWQENR